jgi:hypothetical protein
MSSKVKEMKVEQLTVVEKALHVTATSIKKINLVWFARSYAEETKRKLKKDRNRRKAEGSVKIEKSDGASHLKVTGSDDRNSRELVQRETI